MTNPAMRYKVYFVILLLIIVTLGIIIIANNSNSDDRMIQTVEAEVTTESPSSTPSVEITEADPVVDISTVESVVTAEPEPEYISLGEFRLTAYCSCTKCCGKWGENRPVDAEGNTIVYTASGTRAQAGVTIAADTSVLPFGTKVYIDGHEYIVQDRGGAIKENRIDIYFDSHQEALNFGVKYKEVFIKNDSDK